MAAYGQFEFEQGLQAGVAIDLGGFAQLARQAFERRVEGESHVPDSAGKDEDDGAEFDPEMAGGEEADHREHHGRQEAEYRDGLHDVERGDQEGLDTLVVGGQVAVADGEGEAENVREEDADDGVEGVQRKCARAERDDGLLFAGASPEHADAYDGVEGGEANDRDADVEKEGPAALKDLAASHGLAFGNNAGEAVPEVHPSLSTPDSSVSSSSPETRAALVKRRRAASKSKSSA